jgi:uncharacterized protein YbaP (TraB family)
MMTRKYLLLCTLLSCASMADTEGHLVTLWEIEGARNTVYLLGSIHLLREQDHPLPSIIEAAYNDAEVLIMEIDMDDLDPVEAQAAMLALGVLQDSTTLRDLMGNDMYSKASAAASDLDIPLAMLAKTEPWLAALTIEIMLLSKIGFDPSLGIETYMTTKAGEDHKPIEGLETLHEQLGFLDGLALEAQRQMLLSTLLEGAKMRTMMNEMINAWRHGDTNFLDELLLESFAKHEALNNVLIVNRNKRWVTQIMDRLDDTDDYLVVVGALHLVGAGGVPQRLARKGVRIRQLSEPPSVH